jgi:single-strand DNA-binding protein
MLRVSLIGYLGADPELRYSQKGSPIVTFRVAVNLVRNDRQGERQETTEWFRVTVMGKQAEFAQRLTRGARVFVAGRLDITHYESRDGEQRVGFDVWTDELQHLSRRRTDDDAPTDAQDDEAAPERPSRRQGAGGSSATSAPTSQGLAEVDDDDLPF